MFGEIKRTLAVFCCLLNHSIKQFQNRIIIDYLRTQRNLYIQKLNGFPYKTGSKTQFTRREVDVSLYEALSSSYNTYVDTEQLIRTSNLSKCWEVHIVELNELDRKKYHKGLTKDRFRFIMSIGYSTWLLVFFVILVRIFCYNPAHSCYGDNYNSDGIYQKNLDIALSSIFSATDNIWGFYKSSIGQEPDKVNVLAMCRGDVGIDNCRACLNNSIVDLRNLCHTKTDAIVWYENCMLRYSNRSIFYTAERFPMFYYPEVVTVNASKLDEFNEAVETLLDNLRNKAISGGSYLKSAADHITGPDFRVIYGLVQCTPDLSPEQCDDCIIDTAEYIPQKCNGKTRVFFIRPSCTIRYSDERFYNDIVATPDMPLTPPGPPPISFPVHTMNSDGTIIVYLIGLASGSLLILVIVCFCIFMRRREKKRKLLENIESVNEKSGWESLQVDFDAIRVATANFSDTNKLGQGGFGAVYTGVLRNGQKIAVKRLSTDSRQGEQEFRSEVSLLAKLQHRNLVRLLGFCLRGKERLLIYEFVPNSSLDNYIFDPLKHEVLDWNSRKKIICGIARGLLYLHVDSRLRIIHRDLKPSNILLDADKNPKISDFGLARLFSFTETHGNTKTIIGTSGYMAPEYVKQGEFSVKSDVFSFGVIVLEIAISRKKNRNQYEDGDEDLLSHAWKIWEEGTKSNKIDSSLGNEPESVQEMLRFIQIGLLCTQEKFERPTIALAYTMLTCSPFILPVPLKPPFLIDSSVDPKILNLQRNYSAETNSSKTTHSEAN